MGKIEKRFRVEETGMTLFMTDFLVRQSISVQSDPLIEAGPGDVVTAYRETGGGVETIHLKHWGTAEVPDDYVYG